MEQGEVILAVIGLASLIGLISVEGRKARVIIVAVAAAGLYLSRGL